MKQRLIKIDGKTRTDTRYPTGFMDVIQIDKTGENFRLIYDVKGRFTIHRITNQVCYVSMGKEGFLTAKSFNSFVKLIFHETTLGT